MLDSTSVDVFVGEEKTRWALPKKLLCHHSPVFAKAFESGDHEDASDDGSVTPSQNNQGKRKSYNLLDEENATFQLLIAYFYARTFPPATSEQGVGPLLDLYLLALRLEIDSLSIAVVDAVREWYHKSSTYPGLRRVQYIYANTDEDNEMREMMVSSVARLLTTTDTIPLHWAKALQRNGQFAVDIIRAIQLWHLEERSIPDVRDSSIGRDRKMKGGFSAVERQEDSVETEASGMYDSAIGLESQDGDAGEHTKPEISHVDATKGPESAEAGEA